MPTPVATIANLTATGDVIVGPGGFTTMVKGLPCACLGDIVTGPFCVAGAITMSLSLNKIAKGRPQVGIGSLVSGISIIGVPVATAVLVCPNANVIV
ncbi:MAG: hypothetical protein LBV52_00520 [Spirochaetaceae bacterium]|jgi:hypothetical protein|nr:hypothetical protein [Spirochaetaceae bacterium]